MEKQKITFLPFESSLEVPKGMTILEATREANLPLKASCGGKGNCGNCAVRVLSGKYRTKTSAALPEELLKENYVLACQTKIMGDMRVILPSFEELSIKIISGSQFFETHRDRISANLNLNPLLKAFSLRLPSPTLEDNYSDLKRVQRELLKNFGVEVEGCEYSVLKKLARAVREKNGEISAVVLKDGPKWTLIDVEAKKKEKKIYGICCDVGTTTVVLHLVDLENGKILNTASGLNQQIKCGEDIISRINYSQKPGRLQELQDLILTTLNNLIEHALRELGISSDSIYFGSISGNTTMIHLLLKLDPQHIRLEPYVPTINKVPLILARDLGLKTSPECRLYFSPLVGSYVGGDITAGILCTPLLREREKVSLFIDAGTNGEIVIGNREWMMTCACSVGPAFEGSGTSCGMPATSGAIERIIFEENGELKYSLVEGKKPKGICGSGLVDLLAELFVHGIIDRTGKFNSKKADDRLVKDERGLGFLIEEGKNSFWGKDIILTERDIANLIRSKGAIFSATSLLLKYAGLNFDDLEAIYIAGGFGENLQIENAIRIGLLPDLEREKFHYLGNTSLLGAYLLLISNENRVLAEKIAENMTYIELNTEPSYMNEFTGALFLPHTDLRLFPSVRKIMGIKS